jgi:hypothetical protein
MLHLINFSTLLVFQKSRLASEKIVGNREKENFKKYPALGESDRKKMPLKKSNCASICWILLSTFWFSSFRASTFAYHIRVLNQCLSNFPFCLSSLLLTKKAVLCKPQSRLLITLNADPDPAFHLNVSKHFITFSGPSTLVYITRTKLTLKHILIWPPHPFGS